MIPFLQSITLADNFEIDPLTFPSLRNASNLQGIIFTNMQAKKSFRLADLCIEQCKELGSIVLSGTLGIGIVPAKLTDSAVPQSWANLTKVSIVNFGNCGYTPVEVDELLKGFSDIISKGFGSAVITPKSITINGINAKPTLTDTKVAEAKANIVAKGWTLLTN